MSFMALGETFERSSDESGASSFVSRRVNVNASVCTKRMTGGESDDRVRHQ